jgi:glycosyltransferase involved in cell wall biosynthesis
MKILFIAMPDSIHAARWISQIVDQGWEVYLFPVYLAWPHPDLRNITLFGFTPFRPSGLDKSVRYKGWASPYLIWDYFQNRIMHRPTLLKEKALARAIRIIKPDLIHSLEIQHAAYLTLDAKKMLPPPFPKWTVSNWGSDIYLFGKMAEHKPKICEVLENCDYYSAECERDVDLARQMGFAGKVLPVLPNGGGYDLQKALALRSPGATSQRKVIALKGYQGWAGRALVGLSALRLCADVLKGYEIVSYSAGEDIKIAAELFQQETGIKVTVLPQVSHADILKVHGSARISIGLSISDAISTSLLEAIVMGSFPIQSCTACANEWIENGTSGFIVPPEDPVKIAETIRNALSNDQLVDSAAEINFQTAHSRLEHDIIKSQVIKTYKEILNQL